MIIIPLNVKSQETGTVKLFSQATVDSQNLGCGTRIIADYDHVRITSFSDLHVKLWRKEDYDLHTDHL